MFGLAKLFGREKRSVVGVTSDTSVPEGLPTFGGSTSGVNVNSYSVLTYAPVWQAVKMIAGDISKLPMNLFRDDGVNREIEKQHPAWWITARQPNDTQHAMEFWNQMLVEHLIWNQSYAHIVRDGGGRPQGMLPLPPSRMWQVDLMQYVDGALIDGMPRYAYMTQYRTEGFFVLMPETIFHIKGLERIPTTEYMQRFKQPAWYNVARDSIGLALASQDFTAKFFSNGANIGGIFTIPTTFTKKAADNLEEGLRKRYGSLENAFRMMVLRDGATFTPTQVNAKDSEMGELREDQKREVANWFNLPPSKLGLDQSFSYSSKAEDNRNYIDQTLSPIMKSITSEAWCKLLTEAEKRADELTFEYDVSKLLMPDRKTVADVGALELMHGFISQNEYRQRINLNPIPDGDQYFTPVNLQNQDEDTEDVDTDDNDGDVDPDDMEDMDESRAITKQQAKATLSKIRREVQRKKPLAFIDWVERNLDEFKLVGSLGQDVQDVLDTSPADTYVSDVIKVVNQTYEWIDTWKEETTSTLG